MEYTHLLPPFEYQKEINLHSYSRKRDHGLHNSFAIDFLWVFEMLGQCYSFYYEKIKL